MIGLLFRAVAVAVALLLFAAIFLRAVDSTLDQYDGPTATAVHSHV